MDIDWTNTTATNTKESYASKPSILPLSAIFNQHSNEDVPSVTNIVSQPLPVAPDNDDADEKQHRGRSEIFIGQPNQHAGETLKCPYCADYFTDANRHYRCGFCKKYCHASHLSEVVSVGQG
eukprot:431305_1